MPVLLKEILEHIKSDLIDVFGSDDGEVTGPIALDTAEKSHCIAFCSAEGQEGAARVRSSGAKFVICKASVVTAIASQRNGKVLVTVVNPRLAFIHAVGLLDPGPVLAGIDPTAVIHPEARIGRNVYTSHHTTVGRNCSVGDGSRIDSLVQIYPDVQIGRRVTIASGAVIGADGFGFERDGDGHLHRFPHLGSVIIGDDVEIGANACIDRGGLGDTIIGTGTKIDDLVYIAHNVRIGGDCLIMASSIVCGSAVIGDRVEVSPAAVIRDKHTVGDGARIGLGAVVVKNVTSGCIVAGVPARSMHRRGE